MAKTVWEYSLHNEALKVVHDAHYLATGFYKANNFVVLPYGDVDAKGSVDWFPDLAFSGISRFWERVRKADVRKIPFGVDEELVSEVLELLEKGNWAQPEVSELKRIWVKAEKEVLETIEDLVFGESGNISGITIYPTHFGNRTSFFAPAKFPSDLIIYVREDADIYTIAEAILTSVTRRAMEDELSATWKESEIFVDWNLIHGPLGRVLRKYQTSRPGVLTLGQISEVQKARIVKKSELFCHKLGVPTVGRLFDTTKLQLTGQSEKLFKTLIEHQNEVVSSDELGNILFQEEDDFSLYAVAKAIERLRDKLEENGISGSYIQAFRGQGYMLRN